MAAGAAGMAPVYARRCGGAQEFRRAKDLNYSATTFTVNITVASLPA